MTFDWIVTLLTDPQGFLKLLRNYFTFPITSSGTDTDILSRLWESVLNHPLWLLVIVLFVLLLGGCLLTSGIAITSDTRREKQEQEKRHLARFQERRQEHSERLAAPDSEPLIEREASYDI